MNPIKTLALPSSARPLAIEFVSGAGFEVVGDNDEHRTGVIGLILRGELDAAASDELDEAARLLLRHDQAGPRGRVAYLELTGLTFVDTAGLDRLLQARDALRAGGRRVLLVGAHGQVRWLLSLAAQRGWLTARPGPTMTSASIADDAAAVPTREQLTRRAS